RRTAISRRLTSSPASEPTVPPTAPNTTNAAMSSPRWIRKLHVGGRNPRLYMTVAMAATGKAGRWPPTNAATRIGSTKTNPGVAPPTSPWTGARTPPTMATPPAPASKPSVGRFVAAVLMGLIAQHYHVSTSLCPQRRAPHRRAERRVETQQDPLDPRLH